MAALPIRLIVNADDYGYFPCVSKGILKAAALGTVTATGILVNGPDLEAQIGWLAGHERLDLGVHLNLTSRKPLTAAMAEKLERWGGSFPGVFAMTGEILSGRIGLDRIAAEWRAQIETAQGFGLSLRFLNSHEHNHMLPPLFALALQLAEECHIPHVRLTRPEWMPPFGLASVARGLLLQAMKLVNARRSGRGIPGFIGLSRSGKLDLAYLKQRFATLKPGQVYELMCHPGHFDANEVTDARLLAYHAWEAELALLTEPELNGLFEEYAIQLVNYRALTGNS